MTSHGLPIQALFSLESQDISDVVMSNMLKIAHIRGFKYLYNTSVDTNVKILTGARRLREVIGEENIVSQFCSSGIINLAWEIIGENTHPYVAMVFLKEGKFFLYIASREDDIGPIVGEYFKFLFKGTPPKKDSVKVAFRYATSQGYQSLTREIQSPKWNEINENYPSRIKKALNETINSTPPFDNGRLILWHGNPGLGKSYAIRALVKHWNAWCKISYIVDPERFFDDPAYAFNVILDSNEAKYTPWSAIDDFDEDDPLSYDVPRKIKTKNWKLLIIEDADEFLRSDAKIRQGQSLSRLLNIGDGLIGQGLNLMILITTNEKIENIHPAISREGRCFADIEFKPFTFKEANKWLSQHGSNETITEEATLANLYAILNKNKKISVEKELEGVGQYL